MTEKYKHKQSNTPTQCIYFFSSSPKFNTPVWGYFLACVLLYARWERCLFTLCYDNSLLFFEVLRQLVCVLLCIVICDVIRSSPWMFGKIRNSTERVVHATICYSEGLEEVELYGQKPSRKLRIPRNPNRPHGSLWPLQERKWN